MIVPCAGADVLTPRALFPDVRTFVLVSREPVVGEGGENEGLRNATLACTRVGGYMIGQQVRRLAAREGILPLLRTFVAAAGLHVRTVTVLPRRAVLSTAEGVRVEYVQDDALRFLATWNSYDDCAVLVKGDEWVFVDASPERACRTVVREGVHRPGVVRRNLTTRFGYCDPDPDGAVIAQRDRAERGQRLRCDMTIATAPTE